MSMIMIKVPRQKTEELKSMIEDGLHLFGKAMNLCEQMCEGEMGERSNYGMRYGMRDNDYYPPQYPMGDYMGERQGVRGTGRYSRY